MSDTELEDLLRQLAPQVLGAVVRRYGNFDLAEDATQEALLQAALQWSRDGLPEYPRGWLITTASRRLIDLLRVEQARRRREDRVARWKIVDIDLEREDQSDDHDDTLILLLMCCHPSLSVSSQIALTLKAVGGLSTREIARAFLVSDDTVARRITRAKDSIGRSGIPFAVPSRDEYHQRVDAVLRVLYLTFNEGYASTVGRELQRIDLAAESIWLTRFVHATVPDNAEATGLLALMLLTHARHLAREDFEGSLIPMAEQDRTKWNDDAIAEGVALIATALQRGPTGPYQIQAAIAAVHDEAAKYEETDWPQIAALYEVLLRIEKNPIVILNYAVAVAMVDGPEAGLNILDQLESDHRVNDSRRFYAVRAHFFEMSGDLVKAQAAYEAAAHRALNLQQQRYLYQQIGRLGH